MERPWARADLLSYRALALRVGKRESTVRDFCRRQGLVCFVMGSERVIWGDFLDAVRPKKTQKQGGRQRTKPKTAGRAYVELGESPNG